ncbi:hypothetical protein HDU84_002830 [Entophlyctis sp. JEL0112]|nr:hypothetical protein HDU84_002830 [Entophlyctis sp. JEL0112]
MKTSRFVARYVRNTSRNAAKRKMILGLLEKGEAFEEETFGAIVMVDISGFTALTSTLLVIDTGQLATSEGIFLILLYHRLQAQQGRRSSEEMTHAVSKFMSKIIDIISFYGGDVIKFLGDALLIAFEAKSGSLADIRYTTRRALICCTEVIIKGKSKAAAAAGSPAKLTRTPTVGAGMGGGSPGSNGGSSTAGSPLKRKMFEVDEDVLDLHVGLSAGSFHHMIIGAVGRRCDYFVHGLPLGEIGAALDNARPGELGIAKSAVEVLELPESVYSQIKIRKYETKGGSQTCEFKSLELLQSLLVKMEPPRLDFLGFSPLSIEAGSPPLPLAMEQEKLAGETGEDSRQDSDDFCFQFMNQSLVKKVKNLQNSTRGVGAGTWSRSRQSRSSSGPNNTSTSTIARMPSIGGLSGIAEEESGAGPSSEYRRVTVMFIKFRFQYSKARAQLLFSTLIDGLDKFNGVTQQFSVDDKGQTFFAVFGLPPWSHENNAVFAVKAAITISDMLKARSLTPFTIGLSTGDLLFSHMGNNIRSEAGLLGDVVNVAARLMIFSKAEGYNIFCDYDTHENTSDLYQHAEIGLHMLKGKLEPVSIWAIKNSRTGIDNMKVNYRDKRFFGYADEKARVADIFSNWITMGEQAVLVVEGPSGMGKTSLLENCLTTISKLSKDSKFDTKFCLIRGSEIEKMNPLFPVRTLIRLMYQIYWRLPASKKGEMRTKNNDPANLKEEAVSKMLVEIDLPSSTELKTPPSPSKDAMGKRKKTTKPTPSSLTIDESLDGIKEFLVACGENPSALWALHPVIDWLGDKMPPVPQDTTEKDRSAMTHSTVLKIIKSMTEEFHVAILCDDLQFMDSETLGLLSTMIRETSKTLYFLFSRSFTIYRLTELANLDSLATTSHINLNGLSLSDTEKLLVWKFRDIGALSINKELLQVIHFRSAGSPFFLEKLADSLLATLPRVIGCDENGSVTTTVSDIDYQEILAINVESAILVTFDQLDHHFQEVLRVASVFGMDFDLSDISSVIEGDYPPDDLIVMAQTLDQFAFLSPNPSSATDTTPGYDLAKYKYSFSHILICNTIYGSQPFGHRQEIHRRIARYLELTMTPGNRASVLPAIAFHYSNTNDQEKMLTYFEMLGLECIERFLFHGKEAKRRTCEGLNVRTNHAEGIAALSKLIRLYESEQRNGTSAMKPLRQAQWYSALAYAESGKKRVQDARRNALKALSLIEAAWPETEEQYNASIKQNSRRHNMLWLRTVGGRVAAMKDANMEKDRVMFRCLEVLHSLALFDSSLPQKDISLVNLSYMNLSIAYGEVYRPEFVTGCFNSAEWHWLSNNRYLSYVYNQQGKKLSGALEEHMRGPRALPIFKGDFSEGLKNLRAFARAAEKVNDMAAFHVNQVFIATTLITIGNLNLAVEETMPHFTLAESTSEHTMAVLYATVLQLASVFTDRKADAENFAATVTGKADYIAGALAKIIHGTCCLFQLRIGNAEKGFEKFQNMINSGMILTSVGQRIPMHLFGFCAIFPFVYFSQEKSDEKKLQTLVETLKTAVSLAKKLWMRPCVEGAAACRMYLAAQLLLEGKASKAVATLVNEINDPVLKSMKTIYGLHLSVIARYATIEKQKETYLEKSRQVLAEIGANGLINWAKGGDYKFE